MATSYFTKEGLPVISFKDFLNGDLQSKKNVVSAFAEACQTVGCFFIADHGIDWEMVQNCFDDMKQFFNLSLEEKLKYQSLNVKEGRGYIPFETQNVSAFMGRSGPNDPLEKFSFGPVKPCPLLSNEHIEFVESWAPNIFPTTPPTMKENISQYYTSLTNLAETLMQIFSLALCVPEDYILTRCNLGAHSLKVNYYPVIENPKPNQDRFAEHTDGSPFTIVCPDESKNSIMVRNVKGEWVFANAPPHTFFVNLGDGLARWTNDKWIATPHKVVFPPKEMATDRISFAFFIQMNHDAVMQCIPCCLDENGTSKYEPISYEEYCAAKMKRLVMPNAY